MATHAGRELGEDRSHASLKTVRRLTSTPSHERTLALFGSEEREVVVERLAIGGFDEGRRAALVARAKALAVVVSPHLPRIVDTRFGATELSIVTASSAGDWLSALAVDEAKQKSRFLALAVELRIVLDVLAALSAMHAYRGAGAPLIHGGLAPCNVFVGVDGHTIAAGALRVPGARAPGIVGYMAPEIALGDGTADARADVYSASALLWEALSGTRLFVEKTSEHILSRQLSGPLPPAVVREPWAQPLVEVAARGLAVDPAQRYAAVNEVAMAIRMVAQARLAAPTRVGRAVESLAEERLLRRKNARAGTSVHASANANANASPVAPVPSRNTPPGGFAVAGAVTTPIPTVSNESSVHGSGMRRVVRAEDISTPLVAFAAVSTTLADDDLEDAPPSIPPTAPAVGPVEPFVQAAPPMTPMAPVAPAAPVPWLLARAAEPITPLSPVVAPRPFETPRPVAPRYDVATNERGARSQRRSRAKRLAFLFLLMSASLFAIVSWAVLLRTNTPVEAVVRVATPNVAPAPAEAPRPTLRDELAPPSPSPSPSPSAARATATMQASPSAVPAASAAEPRPSSGPTKKSDRPRKTRPSAYEPEGI